MKRLLSIAVLLGLAGAVYAGPSGPPAGNYILNVSTSVAHPAFSVSSGTIATQLKLTYGATGYLLWVSTSGVVTTTTTLPTGGDVFKASNQTFTGTNIFSSTTTFNKQVVHAVTGNSGSGSGTGGSVLINATNETGMPFQVFSSSPQVQPMVNIINTSTTNAVALIYVTGASTSTSKVDMNLNDYKPNIQFNELGVVPPAGQFAFQVISDTLQFQAENAGGTALKPRVAMSHPGALMFYELSDNGHFVAFSASNSISSNVTWVLPAADGTSGQFLSTDGSGNLSWTTSSGGGGGGPSGQINTSAQNNVPYYSVSGSSNVLSGASNLTNNGTTVLIYGKTPIVSTATLQAGTTIYVASGTINSLTAGTIYSNIGGLDLIGVTPITFGDAGTHQVQMLAPSTISSNYTLRWPTAQGAVNRVMSNDGSGNLSWQPVILSTETLQAGTTIYVASGTVGELIATNETVTGNATIQGYLQPTEIDMPFASGSAYGQITYGSGLFAIQTCNDFFGHCDIPSSGILLVGSQTVSGQLTVGTYQGGGLSTCGDATHALSWSGGSFGCQAIAGGSGGSSSLAVSSGSATNSVIVSSPTGNVVFDSNTINVALQGATSSFITLRPSSVTLQGVITATSLGALTSVTVRSPLSGSGTSGSPVIIATATTTSTGILTSTDWNTFNGKQAAGSYLTSVSVQSPLSGSGTSGSPVIAATATTTSTGILTSTDWNTFNGKQAAGSYLTAVSVQSPIQGSGTSGSPLFTSTATTTSTGSLTAADWNTFNNKQAAGAYLTSVSVQSPLSGSGASGSPIIAATATTTSTGVLTSVDWNTFNGKISGNQSITLSGDSTGSGTTAITVTAAANQANINTLSASSVTVSGAGGLKANFAVFPGTTPTIVGSASGQTNTAQLEVIASTQVSNVIVFATSTTGTPLISVSTIPATNANDFLLNISSSSGAVAFGVQNNSHVISSGTAPSVSSCGTGSPSVLGTDAAGIITTGTGSPTACTLTFSSTYANTPVCLCVSNGSTTCAPTSSSTSAITFTLGATQTTINYICIGNKG